MLLPAPPMAAKLPPPQSPPPKTRLVLVSQRPNKITDEDEWFARNALPRPALPRENPPSGLPTEYSGAPLLDAFASAGGNTVLAVYGKDYGDRRYLAAWDRAKGAYRYVLDFSRYTGKNGLQGVEYALVEDGTLYVSNTAGGYAKEAGGRNAYLTALEPESGKLLWRSAPLTANAHNFVVLPDVIVCGYGFTAEPDFLYVLDRRGGQVLQKIRLKTAAEYIVRSSSPRSRDRIFVRCYNTDYIFAIK